MRYTWISGPPPPPISALRGTERNESQRRCGSFNHWLAGAPLLDQTTHDAEYVVDRTLTFVEDERVAAHREDADRECEGVIMCRN